MKRLTVQFVALLAIAAPAAAQEAAPADPMAAFYGNTLTIAVPDAYYYARRFVDPDGTWREPRGSSEIRGAWERMPDGSTCHWQTEPAIHSPTRYCYPPTTRQVGETWTTTDPNTGNLVIQKIEPGRN